MSSSGSVGNAIQSSSVLALKSLAVRRPFDPVFVRRLRMGVPPRRPDRPAKHPAKRTRSRRAASTPVHRPGSTRMSAMRPAQPQLRTRPATGTPAAFKRLPLKKLAGPSNRAYPRRHDFMCRRPTTSKLAIHGAQFAAPTVGLYRKEMLYVPVCCKSHKIADDALISSATETHSKSERRTVQLSRSRTRSKAPTAKRAGTNGKRRD